MPDSPGSPASDEMSTIICATDLAISNTAFNTHQNHHTIRRLLAELQPYAGRLWASRDHTGLKKAHDSILCRARSFSLDTTWTNEEIQSTVLFSHGVTFTARTEIREAREGLLQAIRKNWLEPKELIKIGRIVPYHSSRQAPAGSLACPSDLLAEARQGEGSRTTYRITTTFRQLYRLILAGQSSIDTLRSALDGLKKFTSDRDLNEEDNLRQARTLLDPIESTALEYLRGRLGLLEEKLEPFLVNQPLYGHLKKEIEAKLNASAECRTG